MTVSSLYWELKYVLLIPYKLIFLNFSRNILKYFKSHFFVSSTLKVIYFYKFYFIQIIFHFHTINLTLLFQKHITIFKINWESAYCLSVCACFSTLSGDWHELRLLLVRLCDVRASISDTPTRGAATSITYYVTRLQPTTSYSDAVIRPLLLLLHGLQGASSISYYIYYYKSTTTTRRTNQLPVYYYA